MRTIEQIREVLDKYKVKYRVGTPEESEQSMSILDEAIHNFFHEMKVEDEETGQYIRREEIIHDEVCKGIECQDCPFAEGPECRLRRYILHTAPSADVVEVRHGEWVVKANGNNECSICGREKQNGWVNFCGFCGAKMGGIGK